MDEKPNEIVQQIHDQREQLGEHLSELESKVHDAADWRTHYRQHPYWFVGAAFGGGLLLSGMLKGGRRRSGNGHSSSYYSPSNYSEPSAFSNKVKESLSPVKAALITFGASKLKDALGEVLPGFKEHLRDY